MSLHIHYINDSGLQLLAAAAGTVDSGLQLLAAAAGTVEGRTDRISGSNPFAKLAAERLNATPPTIELYNTPQTACPAPLVQPALFLQWLEAALRQ